MFIAHFLKNLNRMFKSKTTLGTIFFGPFLILLVIQGAYTTTDTLNLDVGVVLQTTDDSLIAFEEQLHKEGFNIHRFATLEKCTDALKKGHEDICIYLHQGIQRPQIDFYVDHSKLNLIDPVVNALNDELDIQAANLRDQVIEELSIKVTQSSSLIQEVSDEYDLFVQSDPTGPLQEMIREIEATELAIAKTRIQLQAMQSQSSQSFAQNNKALDEFEDELQHIQSRARSQRSTLASIRAYNTDCDGKLPLLDEVFLSNASDQEIVALAEEYGKCKCVEYYDQNLQSVQDDLNQVIAQADDLKEEIDDARARNNAMSVSVDNTLDDQEGGLDDFSEGKDALSEGLRDYTLGLNNQLDEFGETFAIMDDQAAALRDGVSLTQSAINTPFDVHVNPLSVKKELIVYLFPMIYFFILMFVALLFSSTYVYSERNSLARNRNILSPLNWFVESTATFASLLLLVFVQAIIVLLLADVYLHLGLGVIDLFKVLLVTFFTLSIFVLVGMFIGYLFNSELVVMFIAISTTIVGFLYSDVLNPSELLGVGARFIISLNPFAVAAELVARITLFKVPLDIFFHSLDFFIAEILLLSVALWITVYLKNKER